MKIVTISREFGSGGRELGKRLAEQLGFNYFDREIITEIAKKTEFPLYLKNNRFQGKMFLITNKFYKMLKKYQFQEKSAVFLWTFLS